MIRDCWAGHSQAVQFGMEAAGCAVRRRGRVAVQGTDKVRSFCARGRQG